MRNNLFLRPKVEDFMSGMDEALHSFTDDPDEAMLDIQYDVFLGASNLDSTAIIKLLDDRKDLYNRPRVSQVKENQIARKMGKLEDKIWRLIEDYVKDVTKSIKKVSSGPMPKVQYLNVHGLKEKGTVAEAIVHGLFLHVYNGSSKFIIAFFEDVRMDRKEELEYERLEQQEAEEDWENDEDDY